MELSAPDGWKQIQLEGRAVSAVATSSGATDFRLKLRKNQDWNAKKRLLPPRAPPSDLRFQVSSFRAHPILPLG